MFPRKQGNALFPCFSKHIQTIILNAQKERLSDSIYILLNKSSERIKLTSLTHFRLQVGQ